MLIQSEGFQNLVPYRLSKALLKKGDLPNQFKGTGSVHGGSAL
jgi:hypothetical protein